MFRSIKLPAPHRKKRILWLVTGPRTRFYCFYCYGIHRDSWHLSVIYVFMYFQLKFNFNMQLITKINIFDFYMTLLEHDLHIKRFYRWFRFGRSQSRAVSVSLECATFFPFSFCVFAHCILHTSTYIHKRVLCHGVGGHHVLHTTHTHTCNVHDLKITQNIILCFRALLVRLAFVFVESAVHHRDAQDVYDLINNDLR